MAWKYILFDLDGTLTDPSEGLENCVRYALEAAGRQMPPHETVMQLIGPPLVEGFENFIGLEHEQAVEAQMKYRERYSIIGLFENIPYEGIALTLSRLKSQGKVLALATSKLESYSVRILQHFNLMKYFDVTVGSTPDGSRQRKEDVIREALRRLHLTQEEYGDVIMVGDRKYDVLAAKACGIASLGVYYGFAGMGELEDAGADYVIWNVDEIMQVVGDEEETDSRETDRTLSDMEYRRVDLQEMGNRLRALAKQQREAEDGSRQRKLHQDYYRISDRVATMSCLAQFRHSVDTLDSYYDGENEYYDENMPSFLVAKLEYEKALYDSPYRQELEQEIGHVAFKNIELQMKSVSPETVPLQQEENRMASEYEKLLASAVFEWDGESLSMAGLGRYMTDAQRSVRKRAWGLLQDFMQEHAQEWDSLYDGLVRNRTMQAKKLGYPNFVTPGYYRMQRNCYGQEEIKGFRRQVKQHWVPFVTRLQEERRKRLGVEQLELIDNGVYYKEGNPVPKGSPEQILQNGLRMYRELSPETAGFMEQMVDREMFDVLGRKGKRQGGYMEFLPEPRMPLVFANFNGTSGDVDVITHECGHAFQGYLAGRDDVREHWDITMETAEVHSMSMEFFTNPWMELFFGEDAERFRRMQLEDAICFIPYGCMVDEFQQIAYEYPELTITQRHEVWKRLEKQYRPHLAQEGMAFFEKGGLWQRQQHIYSSPFYYIDYCLAQVCALQYKVMMGEDYQKAWQSYLKLCKLSASGFFTDMICEVGLDSPFEKGCLEKLVHKLEQYMGE